MPFARPIERVPEHVLTTSEFEAMGHPARFERSRHTPMPARQPIFARGGVVPPAPGSSIAPVSADRSGPQFITTRTRVARERSAFLRALVLMASGASVGVLLAMIAQPRLDGGTPHAAVQPQDTGVARVVAPAPPPPVAVAPGPPRVSRGTLPQRRAIDGTPANPTQPGTTITTTTTRRDASGAVIVDAPVTVAPPPPPPKATGKAKGGAPRTRPPVTKSTLAPKPRLDEKDEDLLQRAKDTQTL